MKKALITIFAIAMAVTSVFAQNNKGNVLKQSEGSITFVVDENLPAPSEHLNLTNGKDNSEYAFCQKGFPSHCVKL